VFGVFLWQREGEALVLVVKWVANCKVKRQHLKLLFSAISASNFDSLSHPHFPIFFFYCITQNPYKNLHSIYLCNNHAIFSTQNKKSVITILYTVILIPLSFKINIFISFLSFFFVK